MISVNAFVALQNIKKLPPLFGVISTIALIGIVGFIIWAEFIHKN